MLRLVRNTSATVWLLHSQSRTDAPYERFFYHYEPSRRDSVRRGQSHRSQPGPQFRELLSVTETHRMQPITQAIKEAA